MHALKLLKKIVIIIIIRYFEVLGSSLYSREWCYDTKGGRRTVLVMGNARHFTFIGRRLTNRICWWRVRISVRFRSTVNGMFF